MRLLSLFPSPEGEWSAGRRQGLARPLWLSPCDRAAARRFEAGLRNLLRGARVSCGGVAKPAAATLRLPALHLRTPRAHHVDARTAFRFPVPGSGGAGLAPFGSGTGVVDLIPRFQNVKQYECDIHHSVIAGLDPAIHEAHRKRKRQELLRGKFIMDARVKPGHDAERMAKAVTKYRRGEIGRLRVVADFLPSPDALVPREDVNPPHPEERPKAASRRMGRPTDLGFTRDRHL